MDGWQAALNTDPAGQSDRSGVKKVTALASTVATDRETYQLTALSLPVYILFSTPRCTAIVQCKLILPSGAR